MNEENELDDLFKGKLKQPEEHSAYNEMDWSSMEQLLDEKKGKRVVIYWLRYAGIAAALVLMLGSWWFLSDRKSPVPMGQGLTHHGKKPGNITNGGAPSPKIVQPQSAETPFTIAKDSHHHDANNGNKPIFYPSVANTQPTVKPVVHLADSSANITPGEQLNALELNAYQGLPAINPTDEPTISYTLSSRPGNNAGVKKPVVKTKAPFRPRYAITVWAAPDENSVGGFQESKLGDNVGLLFSAGILKKLTISTGALYSNKPYLTGFANYHTDHQFAVSPDYVNADCHMLDIPLNIGYQVYSKRQNTFSIGTGLSSYIMLHQSFTFDYANANAQSPAAYTVPGTSGYYFGILNLNATYQRRLTSRVSFSLQPYFKLPLTNVGYSQVHLQSTGIAAGLSWDIGSSLKP
jgi:hypothetical protein